MRDPLCNKEDLIETIEFNQQTICEMKEEIEELIFFSKIFLGQSP